MAEQQCFDPCMRNRHASYQAPRQLSRPPKTSYKQGHFDVFAAMASLWPGAVEVPKVVKK